MRVFKRIDSASYFRRQTVDQSSAVFCVSHSESVHISSLCPVNQPIFNFVDRVLYKWDPGVAQMAPSDRPLREKSDREVRGGSRRSFCESRSRRRARGRRAWVSELEHEGVTYSRPSFESGNGFAAGVMAPGIDVSKYSSLARVHRAVSLCFLRTESRQNVTS